MKKILNGFIVQDFLTSSFEKTIPEKSLIDWVYQEFSSKDEIFVDIGSHVGTWSISLANAFRHVYAFEPQRDVYNCLCGNIALAELSSKITAHNTAICSIYGKRELRKNYEGGGEASLVTMSGSLFETVEANPLDNYRLSPIALIKIDVEGSELNVIKSARLTLYNNDFPPILMECWNDERGQQREELFKYVQKLGYTITPINDYPEMYLAKVH